MKEIEFSGKVFSGQGGGREFLKLQWVRRQVEEKLGFDPYLGTLNVRLSSESAKRRKLLERAGHLKICPVEGYRSGRLFKASLGRIECAVVIPEVAGYPNNVLEIISPVNLRENLGLVNGDEITVTVIV